MAREDRRRAASALPRSMRQIAVHDDGLQHVRRVQSATIHKPRESSIFGRQSSSCGHQKRHRGGNWRRRCGAASAVAKKGGARWEDRLLHGRASLYRVSTTLRGRICGEKWWRVVASTSSPCGGVGRGGDSYREGKSASVEALGDQRQAVSSGRWGWEPRGCGRRFGGSTLLVVSKEG
jgi:hypothetical protein